MNVSSVRSTLVKSFKKACVVVGIAVLLFTGFVAGLFWSYVLPHEFEEQAFKELAMKGLPREMAREIDCLARNIYFETKGESLVGQYAVAYVTVNRWKNSRWPDSVCEVVNEVYHHKNGRRVAAFTWTLSGAKNRKPTDLKSYERAILIANEALRSRVPRQWRGVYYYLNPEKVSPSVLKRWEKKGRTPYAEVGRHIFFVETSEKAKSFQKRKKFAG